MKQLGVVGCGNISEVYFYNLTHRFSDVRVRACSDLDPERTAAVKKRYPEIAVLSTEELLADAEIDIVLNLTTPQHHTAVNLAALSAGKHVYTEKPLALSVEDADRVLQLAAKKHLYVGSSPDTVLGSGIQTCRKLIDEGWIGRPTAAFAFMTGHGHESWHPGPEFYYRKGGGPMLDMGPYYVSALVTLLGPAAEVASMTGREADERIITEPARRGTVIPVEIDTHYTVLMRMQSGAIVTLVTSFDVWGSDTPRIEIHGTHGSLSCPDPNGFSGPVLFRKPFSKSWEHLSTAAFPHSDNCRGLGVAEMADAIEEKRTHRASGALARHVLEIMLASGESSLRKCTIPIGFQIEQPAPMPVEFSRMPDINPIVKVEEVL